MKQSFPYKSLILGLLFSALAWGCSEESRPDALLPEEQMVPVLKELEIAYAGVDQTVKDPKQRAAKYEEMNSLVLKKNNLEKKQFFDSYKWYEAHPVLLDTILKQVVMELNADLINLEQGGNVKPQNLAPAAN